MGEDYRRIFGASTTGVPVVRGGAGDTLDVRRVKDAPLDVHIIEPAVDVERVTAITLNGVRFVRERPT